MKVRFFCYNCGKEIKHVDEIHEEDDKNYCSKCIDKITRSKFTKIVKVKKPKKKMSRNKKIAILIFAIVTGFLLVNFIDCYIYLGTDCFSGTP
ncbi:MAG: hypothetical protein IIA83_10675 [Thaumarchaeota archaeon]|nr:hypothetical protein [Nitrososphaerota archaeon]